MGEMKGFEVLKELFSQGHGQQLLILVGGVFQNQGMEHIFKIS